MTASLMTGSLMTGSLMSGTFDRDYVHGRSRAQGKGLVPLDTLFGSVAQEHCGRTIELFRAHRRRSDNLQVGMMGV